MRTAWPSAVSLCGLLFAVWVLSAAEPQSKQAEPDYSKELPKIPPRSPEESRQAIRLKEGFHAEIVASEPLIRSPMAMDFDEYGRAFIVELPEYNEYASKEPHGKGSIKMLEDTDGDGTFDKATVYVSDLTYPSGVTCWDGGVLVGVAPDLIYFKDTTGDGKADYQKKLFTGFGMDRAGEGMFNSFRWRIDNRFHIPTGSIGGEIVPAKADDSEKVVRPINARGQHLLLEPREMTVEATSGGGQHGMSLDDWNLFPVVCANSEPVHLIMYDSRYLARNPFLQAPAPAINIAPDGKFTKLMRISPVEPWRELRTRLRSQGAIPGSDEGGSASGFFTGATGITLYRGDAWPAEYRGNMLVGEVASNMLYRACFEADGVGLIARRADPDAEFLASEDNWFRPVQMANGPDGNLYVLDMYRELIEGAAFLAPEILQHMDPGAGAQKGRIYRIAADGFEYSAPPRLGDWETADLVGLLEHPNAWHRETASRLIYQRQDAAAVAPLKELAANSQSPLARAMSLYSLQGLSALEPSIVLPAMSHPEPNVRQHALKLAEAYPDDDALRQAAVTLSQDDDRRVRYQAAFTLGEFPGDDVTDALVGLAVREGEDRWFQTAVLSSISDRRHAFLTALLGDATFRKQRHVRAMLGSVAGQIGLANDKDEISRLLASLGRLSADDEALAENLIEQLVSKQPGVVGMLSGEAAGKAKQIVAEMFRDAKQTARDAKKRLPQRVGAVRTLGNADFDELASLFDELLQSHQPRPVQAAVLETLARFDEPGVPELILESWPSQSPQLRLTSVETLFTRSAWIGAFLDAIEDDAIARADIDPARISLLQQHDNETIRKRAEKLFAGAGLARRKEVLDEYQVSLKIKGDADRGREHFRKVCAACHKLEGYGEEIGADLNSIRDRGTEAILLHILDPNLEVKPQFMSYFILLDSGRTLTGMIVEETANGLTVRKADNTTESILRVNIEGMRSTGLSFMPEGLEKQLDPPAMADLLSYLNSVN